MCLGTVRAHETPARNGQDWVGWDARGGRKGVLVWVTSVIDRLLSHPSVL